MHICRNVRCKKVTDFEGEGIKLGGLCKDCQIKSLDSEKYSNVYCEACGEVFMIRPKLVGDKANEIGLCAPCKVELDRRLKESW